MLENNIAMFEIMFVMFLTLTANFGIGLTFSKNPGSTSSEGPGQGLGLLYKVCPGKYRNLDK